MSDNTTIFLLGYLRETQWASALMESSIDPDRVRELMQEQKDAYNTNIDYIEELVKNKELFMWQSKEDKK